MQAVSADIAAYDERLVEIQTELLNKAKSKEEYEDLIQEIYKVREDKQKALVASAEQQGVLRRIEEMNIYLDDASTELAEYDEGLVRAYFEKIIVYDDHYEVIFKSGISVDIDK